MGLGYEDVIHLENGTTGRTGAVTKEVRGGNRADYSQKNAKKWQRYLNIPYLAFCLFAIIMLGMVVIKNDNGLVLHGVLVNVNDQVTRLYRPVDDGSPKIWTPEFDLAALNTACGLDLPANVFTMCKNKSVQSADGGSRGIDPVLHILGERHSATNLVTEILNSNFNLEYKKNLTHLDAPYPAKDFGINNHKHNMQKDEGYWPGISIISVRNPYDWVSSMRKTCYFCGTSMENAASSGSIEQLIKSEWKEGQHERPYTFNGIFDMRQRKFCNHLQVAATKTDCVVVVRAEDLILYHRQEKLVWQVQQMTGWEYKTNKIVTKKEYQGHSNSHDQIGLTVVLDNSIMFKNLPNSADNEFIDIVTSEMNPSFEKALGYSVMDSSNGDGKVSR